MDKEDIGDPLPPDVATPEEAIRKIRFAKTEYIYVFRGKRPRKFRGDQSKVMINPKHQVDFKNGRVVHNHPGGTSFSVEDIVGLIKYNVKECILVTANYTFQLQRSGKTWGIDVESEYFLEQLNACKKIADRELEKLVSLGVINSHEKEVEIFHYIWLFFFTQLNDVRYVRRKNAQV